MLTAAASRKTLRFLTINVWSGLDYTGTLTMGAYEPAGRREQRYQALVAQIQALDPDVIGVQEANMLPHYAEWLAADLEYAVFYHVGVGGVRAGPPSASPGISAKGTCCWRSRIWLRPLPAADNSPGGMSAM